MDHIPPGERKLAIAVFKAIHGDDLDRALSNEPMKPRIDGAMKKYRAQLWHEGTNVLLGRFATLEERDAAIAEAKFKRSIGLPIK